MPYGRMATDRYVGIDFARMREYRLERTRAQMRADGIDLLITWDPYSIRYIVGGYVTVPNRFASAQCVILPVEGDPYSYILTSFSPFALQKEMPWLKGKVWSNLGAIRWAKSTAELSKYVKAIEMIMEENDLRNPRVGLDGCINQLLVTKMLGEMGLNDYMDATHLMFGARAIKNEDEIACMKLACYSADAAFADIMDAIRPGIRECDLVGIGMKRLYEMGADEVQEFVCASGPRTNPLHIDFTDRAVAPGDLVVVDINGNSYMGYKSCYYRTFCCGKATQAQHDGYKIAKDMMYDGMAGIKAGAHVSDVTKAWPKTPEMWGFEDWQHCRGFVLGHGLGISLHESPEMFWPWFIGANEQLEEGMVLAVETYYGPKGGDWGVRLEEDLVVTKDGYELLTKFPVDRLLECWL
jgi:Xaa-Pro aminopeptidase